MFILSSLGDRFHEVWTLAGSERVAMEYPPDIETLHRTLSTLAGIHGVCGGIDDLEGISPADLRLSSLAHLPHGAMLRTGGGLESEALIQFEFQLDPSESGWRTLEFLAWFVRDQARGGVPIQLRPFALPPVAGDQVQLGSSLRFHLDIFCPQTGEDLSAPFARVREIAKGLSLAITLYGEMLQERGGPGLSAAPA